MMDLTRFRHRLSTDGWVTFPSVVPRTLIAEMRADAKARASVTLGLQRKAGIEGEHDGTTHHVITRRNSFGRFLARLPLRRYVRDAFGGSPYILHALNAVFLHRGRNSYVQQIHRDARFFSGNVRILLNGLVFLDDVTSANGATRLLRGSHKSSTCPALADFEANAEELVGPAGTVTLFDSLLWHRAGINSTKRPRAVLTIVFSRPFIQQRIDYPRYLGPAYGRKASEQTRQLLGYYARTPTDLGEWYLPKDQRPFRADQW